MIENFVIDTVTKETGAASVGNYKIICFFIFINWVDN